jgi:hypothetical protein
MRPPIRPLDVTLSLVTEALVQEAIRIEDVPNAVFEAVPSLRDFLNAEGRFQIVDGAELPRDEPDRRGIPSSFTADTRLRRGKATSTNS